MFNLGTIYLGPERPPLTEPVQLVFYGVKWNQETHGERLLTREQYETLQSYEPMLNRGSYEEYEAEFNRQAQIKYAYSLEKSTVTRQNYEQVCSDIESREDFYGWYNPSLQNR